MLLQYKCEEALHGLGVEVIQAGAPDAALNEVSILDLIGVKR